MARATRISCLVAIAVASVALAARAAPIDVEGAGNAFQATIPDGFVALPGVRTGAYAFAENQPSGERRIVTLRVLEGTVSRAPWLLDQLRADLRRASPDTHVTIESAPAMDLAVPLVLAETPGSDTMALATLPVMPHAVQLTVSGGPDDRAAVERLARAVMASFHAPSNWLTDRQIAWRRAAYVLLALGVALGAAFLAMTSTRLRPRFKPPAEVVCLVGITALFASATVVLARLPHGATSIHPAAPAVIAAVALVQAVLAGRAARTAQR